MNTEKGIITKLGELIDQHSTERRSQPRPSHNRWRARLLPSPGNVIFTLLLIGGLLWGQNAGVLNLFAAPNAQTVSTGTIPYQGRLADAAGNPLTSTVNMSFRLYNAATGGAPLWEEQWTGSNGVQVSDGLFNVMLGSLTAIDQGVITGNSNLFLGITVGTDGEMTPRVQLGSVPYAVQALTVPDGSITSRKLKLSHGEARANIEGDPWSMELTTDYIEVPGTLVEITLDTPQTVIVNGHYDFIVSDDGWADGGLFVNGRREVKHAIQKINGRGNMGQTWILNLGTGTHTFYLAVRKRANTGTVSIVQTHTNLTWFSFAR